MDITTEIKGVPEIMRMLERIAGDAGPAMSRALNRTAAGMRTDMTRLAVQELNLTATEVRGPLSNPKIKIIPATPTHLQAHIYRSGKKPSLYDYIGTRQTPTGVSVQVHRWARRSVIKHTFIAQMKSGHKGVFWREWHERTTGPKTKRGKPKNKLAWENFSPYTPQNLSGAYVDYRLKIIERFGPSVEWTLKRPEFAEQLKMMAGERLLKAARHELSRALKHG